LQRSVSGFFSDVDLGRIILWINSLAFRRLFLRIFYTTWRSSSNIIKQRPASLFTLKNCEEKARKRIVKFCFSIVSFLAHLLYCIEFIVMSTTYNKKVTFSELTIREYPLILGDNPSVSEGAPLSLGWKPQQSYTRNLDLYEYTRGERKAKVQRRTVQDRAKILLCSGYDIEEIARTTLMVEEIKKMRADSLKSSGFGDRAKLLLETTGKIPKDILSGMANLLVVKPTKSTITARSA
jgi:hypothetical protein